MRIESIVKSVQVLVQADTMIADMQLRSALARAAFMFVALMIGLFGLGMLGLAGYGYLSTLWGPVTAAFVIGLAALALSLIVVLCAGFFKPGRELEIARELHNTAFNSLVADVKLAGDDVLTFRNLLRGRFDSPLLSIAVPLVMLLLKAIRTRTKEAGSTEEPTNG